MATIASEGAAPSPVRNLTRGDAIGRYVVLERLGAGGMGIVYAAYDPELDRRVAIKLIRAAADPARAETARVRLLREAQSLAKLSHPNVIAVHDAGTYEGQVFVAMEYVAGRDLAQWLRDERRGWPEIVGVFVAAGRGLAAAHGAGIVHRDFKPENVLVGDDGRVRVLDFGLAHGAVDERASLGLDISARLSRSTFDGGTQEEDERELALRSTGPASQVSTKLTQAGALVGTPAYMAPEQHLGRPTDARTDQFSFCVALFEALYRVRPFPGSTPHELMFSVLKGNVVDPPRTSNVPAWVRRVLATGLAIDPDARWPDVDALLGALSVDGRAQRRRWGVVGVGVIAVAGALWAMLPRGEESGPGACSGAERKLAGIWDESVRGRIHDAFLATDRPYAADAFTTTARYLDAYTGAWVDAHTEACEATAIRKEQSQEMLDRQMLCLDRRLREVEELTTLFRDADDRLVQRAVAAAGQLTPLEPCSDREALALDVAPMTGERAAQAAEIDAMLAGASQRLHVGRYDPGLKMARAALGAARELDYPPGEASALVLRGRAEEHLGRFADAERTLHDALWRADEAAADIERARAWTILAWVVGYRQERYEEIDRLAAHARHALTRAGGDASVEAELHNNIGTAAFARGEWARAITQWDEALRLRRQVNPEHPELAATLTNLAFAHARDGNFEQAEASLQQAQELAEALYGANHPRTANLLHSRALLAYEQARYDDAIGLLRRTLLVRELILAPKHIDTARAVHDLGEALLRIDDARAALAQFQRAVELKQASLQADHATVANSLAGVGRAQAALGDTNAAAGALTEAEQMYARLQVHDANRAEAQLAHAQVLADTDPAQARRWAEAAIAWYEQSKTHPEPLARARQLLASLGA
jgi:tetratricopeptide (TPR) repeat protein/tRNA A-37 threonylcarbamoyl transferase component Bud32